jgi:urea transport system ATP-binding protein
VSLVVDNLDAGYGESHVLHSVSLEVREGEAVCLLGRNGVGKSTLVQALVGLISPMGGTIHFGGEDITREPTYRIARRGIGYVPQGREVFGSLTVEENLRLAQGSRGGRHDVYDFFPRLAERRAQRAGTMSGGEQQQLAIARALMTDPKIIILDEPSEGIQINIVMQIRELLKQLSSELGLAILLIEQDLDFALDVGERGYVMEKGRIVTQGTADDLRNSEALETFLVI